MNVALEIARQTIMQSQVGMGVATNNIANSKVDGYTRQEVGFGTNLYLATGKYSVGTGATINSINRVRAGFYDKQFRDNIGIYGNASAMTASLKRIEAFFGAVDGDTGVKSGFTELFNSLEELSKSPESIGMKQIVKDSAVGLANSFNQVARNLDVMKEQYSGFTQSKVTEVNEMLESLNRVNQEIGRLTAMGQSPNDLLDARDRLIDGLSKNMDITVVPTDNNMVNIVSNGHILIQQGYVGKLTMNTAPDNSVTVAFADGGTFNSTNGELKALVDTVNTLIPKYQAEIDTLARDFITEFNKVHASGIAADGTTGVNFFEGTDAGSIRVSDEILNNPSIIATSTDGTAGNNDIVLQMIAVKDSKIIGGEFGVIEFYDKISATIAAETKASSTKESNYMQITKEVYVMRSNEIGVNEDEELIAANNYQSTYAAASKILSTLQDMFNSLMQAI